MWLCEKNNEEEKETSLAKKKREEDKLRRSLKVHFITIAPVQSKICDRKLRVCIWKALILYANNCSQLWGTINNDDNDEENESDEQYESMTRRKLGSFALENGSDDQFGGNTRRKPSSCTQKK